MASYELKLRWIRRHQLERDGLGRDRQAHFRSNPANTEIPSFATIIHHENLLDVFHRLRRVGGQATGPDGVRYDDLSNREAATIMRQLADELQAGQYRPGPVRQVRIPKANHRGYRTLSVVSIVGRVVDRAVTEAITPFFDRQFLPHSFGFRPGCSVLGFLAILERLILEEGLSVVTTDDIRSAFDCVPIGRAIELLQRPIPDPQLRELVDTLLKGPTSNRTRGIPQGSALSPLTLNNLLHHELDLPSSQETQHPLWLRWADNLTYLTKSVPEGKAALSKAKILLTQLGMELKGEDGPPRDLSVTGTTVHILGFKIQKHDRALQYDAADSAWTTLENSIQDTLGSPNPTQAVGEVVRGWLSAYGPTFEDDGVNKVMEGRVQSIAARAGLRELPDPKAVMEEAHTRWILSKGRSQGNLMAAGSATHDPHMQMCSQPTGSYRPVMAGKPVRFTGKAEGADPSPAGGSIEEIV